MTAQEFTLTPEPATLTTGELATRIGKRTGTTPPTTQTVRNHADAGRISGTKTDQGWRFRPEAVDEWVRNVPTPRTGGRRRGSGRKKEHGDRPLTRQAADVQHARDAVRARLTHDDRGEPPPLEPVGMMRLGDVLRCSREELMVLATCAADESLMSEAQMRRLRELQDLKGGELKLRKEMGELVPVSDIEDAWRDAAALVAAALENTPKRTAARIAAVCWPGDRTRQTIAGVLKGAGVEGAVITAVLGELAQPPELVGRVRELLSKEIGEAMHAIARGPGDTETPPT